MSKTSGRVEDVNRITNERALLRSYAEEGRKLDTRVDQIKTGKKVTNPISEDVLGTFRTSKDQQLAIIDRKLLDELERSHRAVPFFLEAGPRRQLRFDPQNVRAAIVTPGGLAPGLNSVVHGIVQRHFSTYRLAAETGKIIGVRDSFRGLCHLGDNMIGLDPGLTETWLDEGGSKLGNVRYYHGDETGEKAIDLMVREIAGNLEEYEIEILYVIGGDGSLRVAHKIAEACPALSVVGIPKTMDNDLLWVNQAPGFSTAVEQAERVINTLHHEARSTRRICLIELFGAEAGFVAANSTLASGHVDLVLIPEVFQKLDPPEIESYLDGAVDHLRRRAHREPHEHHALVVVAEGVGTVLKAKGIEIQGEETSKENILQLLKERISQDVKDAVFTNEPRHYIRSVPPNSYDRIYCERLGLLAVDSALAGYRDCMVSQWLTEFVLVPLSMVVQGKKGINVRGRFWKQVVSSTGQPISRVERISGR